MKNLIVGVGLALLLALSWGCSASHFACTTEASFNKDGTWSYKSCKNQENMKVKISEDAQGRTVAELETTASTPEAAIAAASSSLAKMADLLSALIPLLQKATAVATKGAVP